MNMRYTNDRLLLDQYGQAYQPTLLQDHEQGLPVDS